MKRNIISLFIGIASLIGGQLTAQTNQPGTNGIRTYVNPVLAGDHPPPKTKEDCNSQDQKAVNNRHQTGLI